MKFVKKLDDIFASLLLLAIVVLTISSVGLRYIFNHPILWVEEVLISLYIWFIMIGAVCAMKSRKHISIDAICLVLSPLSQSRLRYLNDMISIIILCIFAYVGYQLASDATEKITGSLQISYYYIDLAVPVGALWMALHLLINLIESINKNNKKINIQDNPDHQKV